MQYLTLNQSGSLCFTLSDNSGSNIQSGSYYVLEISSDSSKNVYSILVQDKSLYPNQYNKFNVFVTGSNSSSSINDVVISDDGNYTYDIYQAINSSSISHSLNSLETGRIIIGNSKNVDTTLFFTGSQNYKYYTSI